MKLLTINIIIALVFIPFVLVAELNEETAAKIDKMKNHIPEDFYYFYFPASGIGQTQEEAEKNAEEEAFIKASMRISTSVEVLQKNYTNVKKVEDEEIYEEIIEYSVEIRSNNEIEGAEVILTATYQTDEGFESWVLLKVPYASIDMTRRLIEAYERKAAKFVSDGDYEKAIYMYEAIFILDPEYYPAYIPAVAACHEYGPNSLEKMRLWLCKLEDITEENEELDYTSEIAEYRQRCSHTLQGLTRLDIAGCGCDTNIKNVTHFPLRSGGFILGPIGVCALGAGIGLFFNSKKLDREANALYNEYQDLLITGTATEMDYKYSEANDRLDKSIIHRNLGLSLLGGGVAAIGIGIFMIFKKKKLIENPITFQFAPVPQGGIGTICIRF